MIEPVLSSDSIDAILSFVNAGGGIAFSAELPIRKLLATGQLAAVPIKDRDMHALQMEIQSLSGRTLSQAAKAFLSTLIVKAPTPG